MCEDQIYFSTKHNASPDLEAKWNQINRKTHEKDVEAKEQHKGLGADTEPFSGHLKTSKESLDDVDV